MGYKCTFMDNEVYYAEDVNAMFANLTSEGVALRDSGNTLSNLNEAVSEVVSEGVASFPDSCKLTVTDGVYKIGEGVCFMPDGSVITFDENGYVVSPIAEVTSYVYIKRNDTMNTIDVIVSDAEGDADSVPIARIEADGTIFDTRKYSRAKVKLDQAAQIENFKGTIIGSYNGTETTVIDVGRSDFTRIILNNIKFNDGTKDYTVVPSYHNVVEIKDGEEITFSMHVMINHSTIFSVYITKNANTLKFKTLRADNGREYQVDFDILT